MDTITAPSNTFPEPAFDSANSVKVDDKCESCESIDQSPAVLMMKGSTLPLTGKEQKQKPNSEQPRTEASAWLRAYNPSHHRATKLMELVVPYWLKKHHPHRHSCFQYNCGHHHQQRFSINNDRPPTLFRQPSTNFSIDSILNGSSNKSDGTSNNNGDYNVDVNSGGGDHLHQFNQRSQPTNQLSLLNDREQLFKFFQHYTETGALILPATTTTTPPSPTVPSPLLPPQQSFSSLGKISESPPDTAANPEPSPAKRRPLNRGPRIPFTPNQVLELESKFNQTQYLSSMEVSLLAKRLNLSDSRVRIWFQNRRAREKREHHHNNHHHHHHHHHPQSQNRQNYHQNQQVADDEGDEDRNSLRNKSIFDHNDLIDNNNGDFNVRVPGNPDEDEDQNDASSMLAVIMEERQRQQDDDQEEEE